MELEAQFEPNGGGGGGAVDSVNGQTGDVVLDAGDLEYDGTETYDSGTVGKEISDLNADLNGKLDEPSTAGTSGQVLTSDGEGGQSWQTPQSGGSGNAYELIESITITEDGLTEIEFTQNVDKYNEFVIGCSYDMLTYGEYSTKKLVTATSTKIGVYVNGSQILQKEGFGTNAITAVFAFNRNGGLAVGKNGNGFRVGWLAGGGEFTLAPPISGVITSIKLSILTTGSAFDSTNSPVYRLFGR